jgi:hypothetical protein
MLRWVNKVPGGHNRLFQTKSGDRREGCGGSIRFPVAIIGCFKTKSGDRREGCGGSIRFPVVIIGCFKPNQVAAADVTVGQ